MLANQGFSPVEWTVLLTTVISALGAAVGSVIAVWKTAQVHQQVRPPSNSVTLGALTEGIGQVQHMQTQLMHPDVYVPSPATIGRRIQAAADAGQVATGSDVTRPPGEAPPPGV